MEQAFFIAFSTISIYEVTHTYVQNKTSISSISTVTITIYGLRLPKFPTFAHNIMKNL